ncbi:MAG: 4-hydroxy-tetrahydrodipicolinate reductase, partial [Clostridia bacterium]|nr:4-hydroxy-tetrahydrodipicolinate reductase [Clostridia bacterium]
SANFSLQFNVSLKILGLLVPLKNQDFVLTETHHKHKLDAPSGSAKMMQEKLKNFGVYPSIISLRVGEIVGMHSLSIFDDFETLTIWYG